MAESYTWNEGGDNLGLESWAKVWVSPKGLSQAQGSEVGIHTLPPLMMIYRAGPHQSRKVGGGGGCVASSTSQGPQFRVAFPL